MYTAKNNDLTTQIKINTSLTLDIGSKNNKNAQTIKQITFKNNNKNDKNRPQIFTDGSIAGEKAGIGIYIKNKQHQHYYSYNLKNSSISLG